MLNSLRSSTLPVAVIGAGPVGLAAAAVEGAGCCGGKPIADETACCRKDEAAKAAGAAGCGCGGGEAAGKEAQLASAGSGCG